MQLYWKCIAADNISKEVLIELLHAENSASQTAFSLAISQGDQQVIKIITDYLVKALQVEKVSHFNLIFFMLTIVFSWSQKYKKKVITMNERNIKKHRLVKAATGENSIILQ